MVVERTRASDERDPCSAFVTHGAGHDHGPDLARARDITDVELRILAEGGSFEAGQTVKVKAAEAAPPTAH